MTSRRYLDVDIAYMHNPHASSLVFPLSRHLNGSDMSSTSFWLRVALGSAVVAVLGFAVYRAVARLKWSTAKQAPFFHHASSIAERPNRQRQFFKAPGKSRSTFPTPLTPPPPETSSCSLSHRIAGFQRKVGTKRSHGGAVPSFFCLILTC